MPMSVNPTKDGFFCQEMLARRHEFADPMAWLQAAFTRGVEKGYDLPWFFKDQKLEMLHGEVTELAEAMQEGDPAHIKRELGDVLWWVFALCEQQGLTLQDVTASIAERWMTRRALLEQKCAALGYTLTNIPEDLSKQLWVETKKELKAQEEAQ